MPNNYFEIIFDGSIDGNSRQRDKCIACTFEGLDSKAVSRIRLVRLRAVAVWFMNLSVFQVSSIVFSARIMCLCFVVIGFVMFCLFSGLVVSAAFFISTGSEHVEYP